MHVVGTLSNQQQPLSLRSKVRILCLTPKKCLLFLCASLVGCHVFCPGPMHPTYFMFQLLLAARPLCPRSFLSDVVCAHVRLVLGPLCPSLMYPTLLVRSFMSHVRHVLCSCVPKCFLYLFFYSQSYVCHTLSLVAHVSCAVCPLFVCAHMLLVLVPLCPSPMYPTLCLTSRMSRVLKALSSIHASFALSVSASFCYFQFCVS